MRRLIHGLWFLVCIVSCGGIGPKGADVPGAPSPMMTFVFDDGNDTDYLVARGIFAEHGAVACSAITTGWIDKPGYLSVAQINGLRDAGWEILSHTVSHPNLRFSSRTRIEDELSRSKTTLAGLGIRVNNLVYPYNMNNGTVREIAGKYYRSGRGGKNELTTRDTDPYHLRSYANKHDLAGMMRYIDEAHAHRAWIIFYHHTVDIKAGITDRMGSFIPGEKLLFSPSGAIGRYEPPTWYLVLGSLYFVPLSGTPSIGDAVTGETSKARARIEEILYDERAQISAMIKYARTRYPDMRIVTIDQGLDILGVPKIQ